MSRRRRQATQRRKLLFTCKSELTGGQGIGHPARFLGDPPRVNREENNSHGKRHPRPQYVYLGYRKTAFRPGERVVAYREQSDTGHGQNTERNGAADRQDRRRDRNRCQQQERERIFKAARQIQQRRKLHDIEGKKPGRCPFPEPHRGRMTRHHNQIQKKRRAHDRESRGERYRKTEPEMHDQKGHHLAADSDPTDECQGPQTHRVGGRGHRFIGRVHRRNVVDRAVAAGSIHLSPRKSRAHVYRDVPPE